MRESDHRGRENLSAPFTEAQASRAAGEARGTRPERVSPCILPEYKGIQASLFEPDKSDHPRLRAEVRLMEGNWLVPQKKKITNHDLFPYPVQGPNTRWGDAPRLQLAMFFIRALISTLISTINPTPSDCPRYEDRGPRGDENHAMRRRSLAMLKKRNQPTNRPLEEDQVRSSCSNVDAWHVQ